MCGPYGAEATSGGSGSRREVRAQDELALETARVPQRFAPGERVEPPCCVARFPLEEPFPPRRYIERAYDVRRFTEMPRGGHFAALEQPRLLASDLVAFIRELE